MSLVMYKLLESYTKTTESDTHILSSLCCCCGSVTKWCPTLCNRMDCHLPGSLVLHYLPIFAQIHVHWVGDAIEQTYFLPSPSPFAFSLSQHQCLFQWSQLFKSGGQMIGASALESVLSMNIQRWFPWALTGWISLQPKELSRVLKHHSSKASLCQCSPSLWSNSHIHTDNWKKNIALFTLSLYKFCWCLFHEVCELLF